MINTYGMLSGKRIRYEMERGNIKIDPFDINLLGPNSYNVHLADELLTYEHAMLDMKKDEPCVIEHISSSVGKLLIPGKLYLGRTVERTETIGFVPGIEGRSSIGRLGVSIHSTAGFGDNGFEGYWTLEISCVQPTVIYPGVEIGQLYWYTLAESDENGDGHEIDPILYSSNGKYQKNDGIQKSLLYKEFIK